MQSLGDLLKAYILLNTLLATSSAPLIMNDKWINMVLIMVIIPVMMSILPRGGNLFGRLAIDAPFLMMASLIGLGSVAGLAKINRRVEIDFKNYGKTTKSTGTVVGLRAAGLLLGFLISYFLFGKKMYKHYNTI
tara:strand:- start:17799 stop:18200 length:402 start_codon:yes stop_codon:yes gene_type:complete